MHREWDNTSRATNSLSVYTTTVISNEAKTPPLTAASPLCLLLHLHHVLGHMHEPSALATLWNWRPRRRTTKATYCKDKSSHEGRAYSASQSQTASTHLAFVIAVVRKTFHQPCWATYWEQKFEKAMDISAINIAIICKATARDPSPNLHLLFRML